MNATIATLVQDYEQTIGAGDGPATFDAELALRHALWALTDADLDAIHAELVEAQRNASAIVAYVIDSKALAAESRYL